LVRQVWPESLEDVDPVALYGADDRPPPPGRPWVLVDMVASADGGTTIGDASGGLGGAGDRAVFGALRAAADVILVGAATVRADRYGPVRLPEHQQAARIERGQTPLPRLAIVTRNPTFDLATPLFTDSRPAPLIITTATASPAARVEAADRADLLLAGHGDSVDLGAALAALAEMEVGVVLCEGGPTLVGQLAEADLLDELCLTIEPVLLAGGSSRIAKGPSPGVEQRLQLRRILEAEGALFLRYTR
jgi:riboflavin biosynthesis pyrimidine reductase